MARGDKHNAQARLNRARTNVLKHRAAWAAQSVAGRAYDRHRNMLGAVCIYSGPSNARAIALLAREAAAEVYNAAAAPDQTLDDVLAAILARELNHAMSEQALAHAVFVAEPAPAAVHLPAAGEAGPALEHLRQNVRRCNEVMDYAAAGVAEPPVLADESPAAANLAKWLAKEKREAERLAALDPEFVYECV